MSASLNVTKSLFRPTSDAQGPEIKFRAVCALGWAWHNCLSDFRLTCERRNRRKIEWMQWFSFIEAEMLTTINQFSSRNLNTWPTEICDKLLRIKSEPKFDDSPSVAAFVHTLADLICSPEALNPVSQFGYFNRRGFDLATEMIFAPEWSTPLVQSYWELKEPLPCRLAESIKGKFQPITFRDDEFAKAAYIEIRINTNSDLLPISLPAYLALEFQMMHEYISHVLPNWESGGILEHCFLMPIMEKYFRSRHQDGTVGYFIDQLEKECLNDGDYLGRYNVRNHISYILGDRVLSRVLLELAVLPEDTMPKDRKIAFLDMLYSLPVPGGDRMAGIDNRIIMRLLQQPLITKAYKVLQKAFRRFD